MVYLYSGNAPWLQQLSRRNLADVCVAFNRWLAFAGRGVLRKHALQEKRLPPRPAFAGRGVVRNDGL